VAGKSGRDTKFKEALTVRFWQALSLQHLLPFIGTFEDVQVEVGSGVSSLCENLLLRCSLSHVWVSIAICSSSSYSSTSASSSSSLCLRLHLPRYVLSLSLSLFHYYLSVSLSISLSSLRISPRASLLKSRDRCKADSILRSSREVSHPSTNSRRNKFVLEFSWQIFHKLCFIIQLIRFGNIKLQKMFF
jgi:hypothetical protein